MQVYGKSGEWIVADRNKVVGQPGLAKSKSIGKPELRSWERIEPDGAGGAAQKTKQMPHTE